jgi:hypothetical protein
MKRFAYILVGFALLATTLRTAAQEPGPPKPNDMPPPDQRDGMPPAPEGSTPEPADTTGASSSGTATTTTTNANESLPEKEEWENKRNPFWPIGYVPPLDVSDEERRRQQLQERANWPKLSYTPPTRLPSGEMVCIVKGFGLIEKGSIVRIEKGGLVYRWQINNINEEGIEAERLPLRAVKP